MALRFKADGRMEGQKQAFLNYERDIRKGKIPCPFTVEFRNSRYDRCKSKLLAKGLVVCSQFIPLTPNGKPKIQLFI